MKPIKQYFKHLVIYLIAIWSLLLIGFGALIGIKTFILLANNQSVDITELILLEMISVSTLPVLTGAIILNGLKKYI